MRIRRNTITALIIVFCFTASLFMVIPTRSATSPYDPWIDSNDDGKINLQDLVLLANSYGTTGTPINKTALLLDLEERMDALNASLLSLQEYFNARITTLEATVGEQQVRIADLENEVAVLNASGRALIAEAHSYPYVQTSSVTWVDMQGMNASLPPEAAQRSCMLLIILSGEGRTSELGPYAKVRAMVSGPELPWTLVSPTESMWITSNGMQYYTLTFFMTNALGYDAVKFQWYYSASVGYVTAYTPHAYVIAFPA